jgi:hypothetical protein
MQEALSRRWVRYKDVATELSLQQRLDLTLHSLGHGAKWGSRRKTQW